MIERLSLLRRLGAQTSYEAELGWAAGRFGVIVAAAMATPLLLRGTVAFPVVIGLLVFGLIYSPVLLYLLRRRQVNLVLGLGLLLDNVALLIGWWVATRASAGAQRTDDLWLILIPVVIAGVMRMGRIIGTLYMMGWLGWMSWTFIYYYGVGSYDVDQLPVRIAFTIVIVALVMHLMSLVGRRHNDDLERLAAMERMEVLKSTLLRAVAHDIRSPMTAVRAAAEMLTDDSIDLSTDQRRRLGVALRRGVQRLDRTVEDSLNYAELKAGGAKLRFANLEMSMIVENAVEVVRGMIELRSQTIEVGVSSSPLLISGDRPWLIQMLTNILTNAVERAPDGTPIKVCVSRVFDVAQVAVSNEGEPIPETEQAVIFEEYYRGAVPDRHIASSIGLGLASAKRIAEEHGGSIAVASPVGGLTTFTITLPAVDSIRTS